MSPSPSGLHSIGCMRSSNLELGPSFHLRISVQMAAAPPIEPAMTAMAMIVFLPKLLALPDVLELEVPVGTAAVAMRESVDGCAAVVVSAAAAAEVAVVVGARMGVVVVETTSVEEELVTFAALRDAEEDTLDMLETEEVGVGVVVVVVESPAMRLPIMPPSVVVVVVAGSAWRKSK